ncbi:hypothetical protein A1O7_05749 [Cladophialophora yegresii CBS 114405]|uniref:carbonic anhydrase n=1 Tax=Cladophialophora yegresii CBS 114405 TaxID=1182544 RepID=W9WIK5_9EURO|nr:uncharacterized protein A1O7_05749 [Cladophialophora yegresii CBS 114405]EXJ58324.1 hypothetical protein A1O7_05749 [Cladophialophora yegresii CBS 114405]
MFASLFLTSLTAVAKVSANCAHGTSVFPRLPNVTVSTFGYDALKGPLNWYALNKTANAACEKGTTQSPIVINSTISRVQGSTLNWTVPDYSDGAEFQNLGTNVEVIVDGSLVDMSSGAAYSLAQFHFHTPAEHRVEDEFYPMEMHWVFESEGTATPQFAVVAFLVELCESPGCTDPVLAAVFSTIDDIAVPGEAAMTGPLAFGQLIDKFENSQVYRYGGSLTTPPCTENVDWLISTESLYIDVPTWLSVKKVIKYNARYTQDVLGGVNLLQNAADDLCKSTSD